MSNKDASFTDVLNIVCAYYREPQAKSLVLVGKKRDIQRLWTALFDTDAVLNMYCYPAARRDIKPKRKNKSLVSNWSIR